MQQTLKQNIPKLIISLITVILTIILAVPIPAQASSNTGLSVNIDGDDFKVGNITWDPNIKLDFKPPGHNATGWLVYLTNTNGQLISDVVYVHTTRMPDTYINGLYSRFLGVTGNEDEEMPIDFWENAPWGAPWNQDQTSRSKEIHDWLNEITKQEGLPMSNALDVVGDYLGEDAFLTFLTNPNTYLVMEACASHEILSGTKYGMYNTASWYGWMLYEKVTSVGAQYGFDEIGTCLKVLYDDDPTNNGWDTSWVDHMLLPRTIKLSEDWEGLPAVPVEGENYKITQDKRVYSSVEGWYSFYGLKDVGLGMLAVRSVAGATTSTYDEPKGDTPAPAPDDSSVITDPQDPTQVANIVKFYEKDITHPNGTVTTQQIASFTRTPTPKTITIEDEPTYKVVDWFTSPTYQSANGTTPKYSNYKKGLTNTQKGTTPKTVTLTPTETTLYVLLKATEVEEEVIPDESNHVLTESKLSILVRDEFYSTYTWAPLKKECTGHCQGHCNHTTEGDHSKDCTPLKNLLPFSLLLVEIPQTHLIV